MSNLAKYPSLENRGVFITGGASGIGAAFVEAFARNGADVCFVDIDVDRAAALTARIQASYGRLVNYQIVDVTHYKALESAVHEASNRMGGLHVLINNAASDERHAVEDFDAEKWRRCMALNLDSAYVAARAAFVEMKPKKQGVILNLSSINALLGPANMPGYVSAKAGLMGLTKALATDFGAYNIRVNAILPGWVATEKQLENWLTEAAEKQWSDQVALKRRLLADDVANLALFLASDDSEMITGQNLVIDAGRT